MNSGYRTVSRILRSKHAKQCFSRLPLRIQYQFNDIGKCGTEVTHALEYICPKDGTKYTQSKYNTCKRPGCPACNKLKQAKWVKKKENDIIPDTPYLFLTQKVPNELNFLIHDNQKVCQDLLFTSIDYAMKKACNPGKLNEQIGFSQGLHTHNQKMLLDHHVHIFIPCGIVKDGVWTPGIDIPFHKFTELFIIRYIQGLVKLHKKGRLYLRRQYRHLSHPKSFEKALKNIPKERWKFHHQLAIGKDAIESILGYLSNTIFSLPISDKRIENFDEEKGLVTIKHRIKDSKRVSGSLTISVEQFVSRLALHVQQKGFKKVRHYGFLSNNVKTEYLNLIFNQLGYEYNADRAKEIEQMSAEEFSEKETNWATPCCEICKERLHLIRNTNAKNRAPPVQAKVES